VRRVFLGFLVLALVSAGWVVGGLPSRAQVQALVQGDPGLTAVMRQREEEARRARRPARRVQAWVPISEVSRNLIHAVLAAEDQKFFGHEGVDWDAIKKSVEVDRARGRVLWLMAPAGYSRGDLAGLGGEPPPPEPAAEEEEEPPEPIAVPEPTRAPPTTPSPQPSPPATPATPGVG